MVNIQEEKQIKAFKKAVKIFDKETISITSDGLKTWSNTGLSDEQLDYRLDNCISDFWLKGIKEDKLIEIDGFSFDVVQLIEPLKKLGKYCNSYPMLLEKYHLDVEQSKIDNQVLEVLNQRIDIKPNNDPFKV